MRLIDNFDFKSINSIKAKSLNEAVDYAFVDKKFKFYLNSELIDIQDRFRIFNFQGTNYLVKKSKVKDAEEELENALKASKILDGKEVSNLCINVVVPQLITRNNYSYLITEYYGCSQQETVYGYNQNNEITFDVLSKLLKLLDKHNVVYRGLLPRNMIIDDKFIHLIDWEDVLYYEDNKKSYLNYQFKTNFILNWKYLFDENKLVELIDDINKGKIILEPELNKYENLYSEIFNSSDILYLRGLIYKTVLFAEKDFIFKNKNIYNFIIKPNDMSHLISDIFTNEIDVLFDLINYRLRHENEKYYNKMIKILSSEIVKMYKGNYIDRSKLILFILAFLDVEFNGIITGKETYEELKEIVLKSDKNSLGCLYLHYDFKALEGNLKEKLYYNISMIDKLKKYNFDFVKNVVQTLKKLRENLETNVIYENEFCILKYDEKYKYFPRLYTLFFKKEELNKKEDILDLAVLQRNVRCIYNCLGIKQVSIYSEFYNGKRIVRFIPFYQKKLRQLKINPDDYQNRLSEYLKSFNGNVDGLKNMNQKFSSMLYKRGFNNVKHD